MRILLTISFVLGLSIFLVGFDGTGKPAGCREVEGLDPDAVIILRWCAIQDAETYGVQVSDNSFFTSLDVDVSGITDTSYSIPANTLSTGTDYYWRVRGETNNGDTPYSSVYMFTTD